MRGGHRPNALPAKHRSVGDFVEKRYGLDRTKAGSKKWKMTVGDACDFCKKHIRVKRVALRMLRNGWRFSCKKCVYENKLNLKKDKVWVETIVGEVRKDEDAPPMKKEKKPYIPPIVKYRQEEAGEEYRRKLSLRNIKRAII